MWPLFLLSREDSLALLGCLPLFGALPKALASAAPILGFFTCSLSRIHSARSQIKKPSRFRSRAL